MKIRQANLKDIEQISELFYVTIITVAAKDYSPEQIKVWASGSDNKEKWRSAINEQNFLVAEQKGKIVGFGSLTGEGWIDYMYVHQHYQHQGIASKILLSLEEIACKLQLHRLWADVSITALAFFKSKGFEIEKNYLKMVNEVVFKNTLLTKKTPADFFVRSKM